MGQPLVLGGKIKCLPPSPTPTSAFWPGRFDDTVSTNRFKHAFTNLTENILLVDAQKVQTDFCFLFFFGKVLTCLKLDSFQGCCTFLWKPEVVVKTIIQPKVQYESNNIWFQKLNFVYFCDLGAVTCFFCCFWGFFGFCFHQKTQG